MVNPVKADVARLRAAVHAEEQSNGWASSTWFETTAADPGGQAARAALQSTPTVVIVAGGDGTLRAAAEELHGSGVPIAIVASGTGNLLARNLDLVADIETGVHTAFTGETRPIDVGVVRLERGDEPATTHVFLVMTGVGLDARMATDTNEALKKRIGWLAYADPISKSVMGNKRFTLHYRADGGAETAVRAHTVIVGNCGTITAGILLLPDAAPDDGLLDVVLLRPKGFWQWLRVGSRLGLNRVLHRTHSARAATRPGGKWREMRYLQARTLSARFDVPEPTQLDGDAFGTATGAEITVLPQALGIVRAQP
ncbi:transcriptional regulator [Microbacterium protaetiae]|uniref:Transcriptional regulator n=1 Tax=Microbacterium protaetiae TaxID=2509458 RepID=A0A4P6EH47_9MICO|nr:transcriptional regulator [Microbacterium protaetiae]